MSIASPQRGLNAQPAGSFARSSGSPGMPVSISTVVSTRGTEASRPRVYGWLGAAKHALIGARSTMRPPYMTCTRSQNSATTPRSWVIMRIETPSSSDSSLSNFRIWSWMVTSSPVVGSSAISSAGSPASAVAIITRWRMPPDSSYGYCFNRSFIWEIPTSSSSSEARTLARSRLTPARLTSTSRSWAPTVFNGFRETIGSWKIMAISRPLTRDCTAGSNMFSPFQRISPLVMRPGGRTRPSMARPMTLLPDPDSPTMPTRSCEPTARVMSSTPLIVPSRVGNEMVRLLTRSSRSLRSCTFPELDPRVIVATRPTVCSCTVCSCMVMLPLPGSRGGSARGRSRRRTTAATARSGSYRARRGRWHSRRR